LPFLVHVSGRLACFPRPEFVSDRVSYDVITPIAARRILEAVYWRREMRWQIDAIHVLAPIRFGYDTMYGVRSLDPVGGSSLAGQPHEFGQLRDPVPLCEEGARRIVLLDPAYLIEARFEMTSAAGNPAQHTKMFARALRHGRYFREPYLGLPGYPAKLMLIEGESASNPPDRQENVEDKDLGWMVHDLSPTDGKLRFFRPQLVGGAIRVPPPESLELAR
jgi:CRISPR-associated protein Cas5d